MADAITIKPRPRCHSPIIIMRYQHFHLRSFVLIIIYSVCEQRRKIDKQIKLSPILIEISELTRQSNKIPAFKAQGIDMPMEDRRV